jgi:redox-sensitive bicupin YhaK (pirin superfamily)
VDSAIELIIAPKERDLGSFSVRRVLPDANRRAVGPFVFFDHVGPAAFGPGQGIDVRPHPHIGLSTVTYLFEGEIIHRDSLGFVQPIRPGAVNWMNAGRGIVHSERTGDEERAAQTRLHGIQSWVGVPLDQEQGEPGFFHHPAETLPEVRLDRAHLKLIAGTLETVTSPVESLSPIFYGDLHLDAGGRMTLPASLGERAAHVVEGRIQVGETVVEETRMAAFKDGVDVELHAEEPARVMVLGGPPLEGVRHVWWNFVSSSRERVEQAKDDWRAGRFGTVPGDDEFIPLPDGD